MKHISALLFLLVLSAAAFAQSITNPWVQRWDENNCRVTKVEVTDKYTVISFEHTSRGANAAVTLYDGIYLQSTTDDSRYPFVKAEGIPVKPEKHYYTKAGEVLPFKVYFKKLEPQVKSFDIIERAGATNYFNFFGVSLERSRPTDEQNRMARRPSESVKIDVATHAPNNMINSMVPMYNEILTMALNAQVAYFSEPEKVAEIAKINKSYYDALVKQGFSKKQAMDIITANPLMQQVSASK